MEQPHIYNTQGYSQSLRIPRTTGSAPRSPGGFGISHVRTPSSGTLANGGQTTPPSPTGLSFISDARSVRSFNDNASDTRSLNPGDVRVDIMVKFLRQRQLEKMWSYNGQAEEGVILKRGKDDFACQPRDLLGVRDGFYDQITRLNVKVAITVRTDVISTYLQTIDTPFIPLADGRRIQVLKDIYALSRCKKHHFAAFISDPPQLIVWHDDPEGLISRAEQIESLLVAMLWRDDNMLESRAVSPAFPGSDWPGSPGLPNLKQTMRIKEKEISEPQEAGADEEMVFYDGPRKTLIYQSFLIGIVGMLIVAAIGVGWRKVAIEVKVDHNYMRFAFAAVFPAQVWLGWFFFQTLVTGISQMIGPVNQILSNSRSYSGIRSKRLNADKQSLPHVTVQCPVYKEGLDTVIEPTMISIRQAISTYEMQGGTANIFVNDDGMQLIPAEEAQARRDYYDEHNIGWVARPKHNPKPAGGEKGFVRPGKFKKASNMNYAMNVSARVEDKLKYIQRPQRWTQQNEEEVYKSTLARILEEDQGRTWADGDIRMGDYILIIDSDTRVPEDCFLDAVSEMEQSPRVAIIQFSSGVMNVTTSFFEQGITFFTNLVYTAIQFAVANGDVAPFVGHNAILRWSALQDIAYQEEGTEKWWAETTVSEDFDMALRLQSKGYDLRFSTYFGRGFEEGVSLTVYDELARWEKYAYGCSELIFQPFQYWFTRGPVTPLFRRFFFSNMPVMAKITIMSYIGTYYAIASSWILTTANYFLIGWFNGYLDHYYVDSFKIFFSIVVVFQALGIVSLAVLRYRVEGRSLIGAFFENLKWLPLLTIFLGGISLHVCQAICCHMCSIDMSWGATSKEAKRTSFFEEVPTILKKFKFTFAFCIIMVTGMIILAGVGPVGAMVPHDFQIKSFTATFPLALVVTFHFIMPLVLNPGLMQFTF